MKHFDANKAHNKKARSDSRVNRFGLCCRTSALTTLAADVEMEEQSVRRLLAVPYLYQCGFFIFIEHVRIAAAELWC